MNLPPLPTALVRGPAGTGSYFDSYTAAQMSEYGQACRDAALEQAAQILSTPEAFRAPVLHHYAAAIRKMIGEIK